MITNTDNQDVVLKNKIKHFFTHTVDIKTNEFCPIRDLFSASLDKWSLFILFNLGYYQIMRFNELKHRIDGISPRMLSVTLKKLEQNNILNRKVYPEVPPRVEYSLTDFGSAFADKLIDLSNWYLEQYPTKTTIQDS